MFQQKMLQILSLIILLKSRHHSESSRDYHCCTGKKKEIKENANLLRIILNMAIEIMFFY